MNSSPFSLETTFHPEDAREDKIDVELKGWEVHGLSLDSETVYGFKRSMGGPPGRSEDFAWPDSGLPARNGWFLICPGRLAKDQGKLAIRTHGITDKKNNRRHEAPLCGGHCLFYKARSPHLETGKPYYEASLNLGVNMQRFTRHQPEDDQPNLVAEYRLQRRPESRSSHGDEFSFDSEDNWIPNTLAWTSFASQERVVQYLDLIAEQLDSDIQRACFYENEEQGSPTVVMKRNMNRFHLNTVETMWEFPSENPIQEVLQIGAKLMHLRREGMAKKGAFQKANRKHNSPCLTIPVAEGVDLRLYPKTNQRIRFEIVHSGVRRRFSKVKKEAADLLDPWEEALSTNAQSLFSLIQHENSWAYLPAILKALRHRAAIHMNQIMEELREGRLTEVKACSVVELMAKVAAAVPAGFGNEAKRLAQIQTLLFLLCYHRGFHGKLEQGAYGKALKYLREAGVIEFDRSRQFYPLSAAYVKAADALGKATGDPILTVFGMNWGSYHLPENGGPPVRLRE